LMGDSVSERGRKCILGALLADAASQPLHWIYQNEKMETILKENGPKLEFHSPSKNPFYTIPLGLNTCYGDQVLVLLESLVENKGVWNPQDYIQKLLKTFGPNTSYEDGMKGRDKLPISFPWRHGSLTKFVNNVNAGKGYPDTGTDDEQVDAILKIIPLVALMAGSEQLIDCVEDVIRITQDNDIAIGFGIASALVLEGCLLGKTAQQSVEACISTLRNPQWKKRSEISSCSFIATKLEDTLLLKGTPHYDVVQKLGKS